MLPYTLFYTGQLFDILMNAIYPSLINSNMNVQRYSNVNGLTLAHIMYIAYTEAKK